MFPDNSWYGHRAVLAEYCGLRDSPAFATIQHGWRWALSAQKKQRAITSAPYLFWNNRVLNDARFKGIDNIRAIGAPFLYLDKISVNEDRFDKGGTIFFPQHSTTLRTRTLNHHDIIGYIEKFFPPPYTVSLYYLEPNYQFLVSTYRSRGWKIFSAGTRANSDFLINIYDEINKNHCVLSNGLSTSLFYAAYKGKEVKILSDFLGADSGVRDLCETDKEFGAFFERLCAGMEGTEAIKFGAYELGESYIMSPENLSSLLGWDSFLKRSSAKLMGRLVDLKVGRSVRLGTKDL